VVYAGPTDMLSVESTKREKAVEKRKESEGEGKREMTMSSGSLVKVHGKEARLQLNADKPHLTFYVGSGTGRSVGTVMGIGGMRSNSWFVGNMYGLGEQYDRICTSPCEASLPVGTYKMAVRLPDNELVIAEELVDIKESSLVNGYYESNTDIRTVGWIVAGSSLAAGILLVVLGYLDREKPEDCRSCDRRSNPVLTTTGVLGGFVGILVGTVMIGTTDEVTVQVTPR